MQAAAAIEAPRWTIGPSRPALAPAPSDRALASALSEALAEPEPAPGIDPRLHDVGHGGGALAGEQVLQHQADQQAADRRGEQDHPPRLLRARRR